MTGNPANTLLHYLRRLAPAGDAAEEDATLLRRYAEQGDEEAFTALLRRHGPGVWGVCTRVLGCTPDAEDAFQATFLVLVRKARSLRRPRRLGAWLYAVACRTARKARARSAQRRAVEGPGAADLAVESTPEVVWREVRAVLDEEVSALPEKYRVPFLLCCLGGLTTDEAARQMGCPRGTVASRLSRARERLRRRLARRGVSVPAGVLAASLAHGAADSAAPAALVASIARCAASAGGFSAPVVALAEGVLHDMFLTKLPLAALALLVLGVLGSAAGLLSGGSATPPELPARATGKPLAPVPEKRTKGDSPEVKKLLKERREALKGEAQARWQEFEAGRGTLASLLDVSRKLLDAELELATKPAERVAAHERHFNTMRKVEAISKEGYEAGRVKAADYKQARAARLAAEIGLRRAGGKPKPGGK